MFPLKIKKVIEYFEIKIAYHLQNLPAINPHA